MLRCNVFVVRQGGRRSVFRELAQGTVQPYIMCITSVAGKWILTSGILVGQSEGSDVTF